MLEKIKIDKPSFGLLFLLISTFLLSQSYSAVISFAQPEPGSASAVTKSPTKSILVCEFVQYCSNPKESSANDNNTAVITPVTPETEAQTPAETEAQTTPNSSELLPDVTSNISLIMTPDLPGKDSQDVVDQNLLAANETQQISSNATEDSQLAVPENATVITPGSQIPLETTNENISMTIQSINSTSTSGSSPSNQSESAAIIPLGNVTMSFDDNNMSQNTPVDKTIDTTAANETAEIEMPVGNQNQSTASNETINPIATNETINPIATNETINPIATNETINPIATNETINPIATNETINPIATNETINPIATNVNQQNNTSNVNEVQPNPSSPSENQTAPPSFLDPLINPFKQLFGIK